MGVFSYGQRPGMEKFTPKAASAECGKQAHASNHVRPCAVHLNISLAPCRHHARRNDAWFKCDKSNSLSI
jgi:hypothetical protein